MSLRGYKNSGISNDLFIFQNHLLSCEVSMATLTDGAFGQDFEIKDFIGQGTFAKVFRCVEKNTGRDFAVKAFQNEGENFDQKLIDNEVDIWRTLQHRNIVSLYKRFHEHSRVWVVLELVSGKTLLDGILNQIVFPEEESRNIILQVRNSHSTDQMQKDAVAG